MNIKNKNFKSRSMFKIYFLIFIIVMIIIFFSCNINLKNKNLEDKNINHDLLNNNSKKYYLNLQETVLNEKLNKYLKNGYEVSIGSVNDKVIIGDIHDTSYGEELFVTKKLFTYNIYNDELKIYDFDYNYRILNYYILDNFIYATLIFKNSEDEISYEWNIIRFNKNFGDVKVLEIGNIIDPVSAPVYRYNKTDKTLYAIAIDEKFEIIENNIIDRNQNLKIYEIKNNELQLIKQEFGNYTNKVGNMLCSIFDIQLFNNNLLYCITDYQNTQQIITLDLSSRQEETLYVNKLTDNWIINSFQRDKNGMYMGMINTINNQTGKTTYYDFTNDVMSEVYSEILYNRNPFILDGILFHNYEKWKLYSLKDNKFYDVEIDKKYINEYFYPTFYIIEDNKILVKGSNNKFYVGSINANY